MVSEGYFIAPSGDIIPVPEKHITMVLNHPEKFRTTKDDLKKIFDKYQEPYGHEGKAREEILVGLIRQGWIRIRHVPKRDLFTVQIDRLTKRKKDQLYRFAKHALEGLPSLGGVNRKFHSETQVSVIDLNGNYLEAHSLGELAKDVLYKEGRVTTIEQYDPKQSIKDKIREILAKIKKN